MKQKVKSMMFEGNRGNSNSRVQSQLLSVSFRVAFFVDESNWFRVHFDAASSSCSSRMIIYPNYVCSAQFLPSLGLFSDSFNFSKEKGLSRISDSDNQDSKPCVLSHKDTCTRSVYNTVDVNAREYKIPVTRKGKRLSYVYLLLLQSCSFEVKPEPHSIHPLTVNYWIERKKWREYEEGGQDNKREREREREWKRFMSWKKDERLSCTRFKRRRITTHSVFFRENEMSKTFPAESDSLSNSGYILFDSRDRTSSCMRQDSCRSNEIRVTLSIEHFECCRNTNSD